jgi:hypothetical protein
MPINSELGSVYTLIRPLLMLMQRSVLRGGESATIWQLS